jgi:hypothetical protein
MISSGRPAIRSVIAVLALFALAVAGAVTATGKAAVAAGGVEDGGAGCSVSLPGSLTANSLLPDPFTRLNGTRISSVSDWTCRREEILQLAEKYIYGAKPAKPASVTGTVSSTNITVNVSNNGKSASWSAGVQLPSTGSGPFPAVIVYGGSGVDTSTILNSGAAVINYNPFNVGAEGTARDADTGAFYTLYGPSNSTGLLMAWAWGVSRIIDVIEQSGGNILKADDTGVSGCSRFGKGAFVAGVFDQRIPLTMPVESGTDGVPILRGVPGESGAQPLGESFGEQPWVGDAFSQFTSNPGMLPVDTHEMVGMLAPRGVFIMENPHVDWLAATSGSVAALGGAEVYKALGAGNNISYISDVANGTHCAVRPEWQAPMAASIKFFLENTGTPPAVFRISSLKQGNLAQWRNWTTPTLSSSANVVTVTNPGNQTGTVGTAATLQVQATDSAPGQTLTYAATGLPAGLAINATTGLISGTPTTAANNTVTVTATDAAGTAGSATFLWNISGGTGPTVTVTNPGPQAGTVGTAASLQINATDSAAGQTLSYSATGLPAGLAINATTGLISGTPATAASNAVTVTVTDTTGASGSASFAWNISGGGTGTCHVTYTRNSEWPTGFTAQVVIANTGTTAISGWSVTFTYPGDQKVTSNFNGGFSQTGENVTLTNASYNGSIAPGASVTDGFQGSWSASDATPTSFSVNGTACN